MGESDRYQEYRKMRRPGFLLGQDNNALTNLLILNSIFFLLLLTLQVTYYFYNQTPQFYNAQVVQWFELPASFSKFIERPWTLITYVFSDSAGNGHIFRILSNMLWLWAFGSVFQSTAGNDKVIPVYLYGGILGGLIFMLSGNLIPALRPVIDSSALLGANTGTMAVAMATTVLVPRHRFFTQIRGGIPIWVVMAIYLFIDFAGTGSTNVAFKLSHLGGALAGFLFVVLLRQGYDAGSWMNRLYSGFMNLFTPPKKTKRPFVRDKVFYNTGNRSPYKKTSIVTQQRVDEILDKINQRGYHFLTEEEKDVLRKAADEEL